MISIPEHLPLQVAPLTWLLGTWQGWGVFTDVAKLAPSENEGAAEPNPASTCLVEYDVQVVGDQLRLRRTVWRTQPEVSLDNEAPVKEGLAKLERRSIAWQNTQFWTLTQHAKLPEGLLVQASSAASTGLVSLWQGSAQGPRVQLTLDVSASAAQARQLEYGQLLLGVAQSDLFMVEALQFKDSEITLSARLARVADCEPIELLPDGPALAGVLSAIEAEQADA